MGGLDTLHFASDRCDLSNYNSNITPYRYLFFSRSDRARGLSRDFYRKDHLKKILWSNGIETSCVLLELLDLEKSALFDLNYGLFLIEWKKLKIPGVFPAATLVRYFPIFSRPVTLAPWRPRDAPCATLKFKWDVNFPLSQSILDYFEQSELMSCSFGVKC